MKKFMFTVYLIGSGETIEEAWQDAKEDALDNQFKYIPEKNEIRELENEEEEE